MAKGISKRFYWYLFVGIITQIMNVYFICHTYTNNPYIYGLLLGGLGRIIIEANCLVFAYNYKVWARRLLVLFWGATIIAGIVIASKYLISDLIIAIPAIGLSLLYTLFLWIIINGGPYRAWHKTSMADKKGAKDSG